MYESYLRIWDAQSGGRSVNLYIVVVCETWQGKWIEHSWKMNFAPILKKWREIYYILLLKTQSFRNVQYHHIAISGFQAFKGKPEMTKCRYCTIPALYKQTGNSNVPVLYNTGTLWFLTQWFPDFFSWYYLVFSKRFLAFKYVLRIRINM